MAKDNQPSKWETRLLVSRITNTPTWCAVHPGKDVVIPFLSQEFAERAAFLLNKHPKRTKGFIINPRNRYF